MQRDLHGRHLADTRSGASTSRTAQFLRLARRPRDTFASRHAPAGPSRLAQFLRIARGRTV